MQNIFVYLLILLVSASFSCAQTVEKKIGLQLWSVRDDMKADPVGTIEKIGEIGYSFVEAAGYSEGKFYDMDPQEFKTLLNKNGLEFLASHTSRALPDSNSRDEVMAWWDKCIDAHAAAGVSYLVQPSMDKRGYGSLKDLKAYCNYFNLIGEKCNAKGIRFGYHNHDKEFTEVDGVLRYDYMLQNTDPEKVFFQIDLYWVHIGGQDPVDYFNKYPGRFVSWHVKDEKELGESGEMDFEPIFTAAEKSGMNHYIVEVEDYTSTPLESIKVSYDFLMEADYVK